MKEETEGLGKVARAIGWAEFRHTQLPGFLGPEDPETGVLWQGWFSKNERRLREAARAALEAMREPLEELVCNREFAGAAMEDFFDAALSSG